MKVLIQAAVFFIVLFTHSYLLGQIVVSGFVVNDQGQKLEYANIGIRNKNVGTYSKPDGSFSFTIPEAFSNDTVTFSMIGYADENIPVSELRKNEKATVRLNPGKYDLKEVAISAKKLTERKFGITRYHPVLHFMDGSIGQSDIFEIAQLIHLPESYSRLTSVNLFINEPGKDSGVFRLNFYKYENGYPTKRITSNNILQKKAIKEGWLKFDVSAERLYLKGDIVAAIEFFPSKGKDIKYEVKLGGTTKTFFRSSSQGQWQMPPHHYRLFVTALTSADAKDSKEENESLPYARYYSKNINDSLSVFVGLPGSYSKDAAVKYPVVYLLDANVYFDPMLEYLTKKKKEVILVGIGYRDAFQADSLRERDDTYPQALRTDSMKSSGGAGHFFDFFKHELVPYVDSIYNTDTTKRALMGHSFAGYFSLYALQQDSSSHKPVFTSYVIASPPLDYCNGYMMKEYENNDDSAAVFKKVLITIGGKENTTDFTHLLRIMDRRKFKMLRVESKIFPRTDHMETALPTFKEGLDLLSDKE
jgi:predicted alpha/beta superfamily hydrolase